jgi:prepilin-type N-terminal cleavage/methylation domain-containing protein
VLTASAASTRPQGTRPLPDSRGFTLAELVVALGLSSVAFGAFAMVVAHQERAHAELSRRVRAGSQSREGIAALVSELRAVAPRAGDIPPGGARDSAIEFRTTIGSLVVCELRDRTIVAALASFVTPPGPGDTAWTYVDADTAPAWAPLSIADVSMLPIEQPVGCASPAAASTVVTSRRSPRRRYLLSVGQPLPAGIVNGAPVRVTRHIRYSVYRAPDGRWYLGRREWSAAAGRFETVQPVSGPYGDHAALRYFDQTGAELSSGGTATDRIAMIAIALRGPHERREVTSITIGVRNR